MKIYPYILINKNNMTKLHHFKNAIDVADAMYSYRRPMNPENWIVVKNETTVVKFPSVGGDNASIHRKVVDTLNQA